MRQRCVGDRLITARPPIDVAAIRSKSRQAPRRALIGYETVDRSGSGRRGRSAFVGRTGGPKISWRDSRGDYEAGGKAEKDRYRLRGFGTRGTAGWRQRRVRVKGAAAFSPESRCALGTAPAHVHRAVVFAIPAAARSKPGLRIGSKERADHREADEGQQHRCQVPLKWFLVEWENRKYSSWRRSYGACGLSYG